MPNTELNQDLVSEWMNRLNVDAEDELDLSIVEMQEWQGKWIAELRDPNNLQATGMLKAVKDGTVKRCCLGVLIDVIDPDHQTYSWINFDQLEDEDNYGDHGWDGYGVINNTQESKTAPTELPVFVLEKYGLMFDVGPYRKEDLQAPVAFSHFLAGLNDQGMSFPEIADVIETALLVKQAKATQS